MKSIFDGPGKLQGRKSKSSSNSTLDWLNSTPKPATTRKMKKKSIAPVSKSKKTTKLK